MNEDVEDGYIFADAALAGAKEERRETGEDLLVLPLSSSSPDQLLLHDLVMLQSPFYEKRMRLNVFSTILEKFRKTTTRSVDRSLLKGTTYFPLLLGLPRPLSHTPSRNEHNSQTHLYLETKSNACKCKPLLQPQGSSYLCFVPIQRSSLMI